MWSLEFFRDQDKTEVFYQVIFMSQINAATDEVVTNEQLLKRAVSLARTLTAMGAKGKYAFMLMRNHQEMAVIYFAVMFAGVIPFLVEPTSTVCEFQALLFLFEDALENNTMSISTLVKLMLCIMYSSYIRFKNLLF